MANNLKHIKESVEKRFGVQYQNLAFQAGDTKDGANGVHYTYLAEGKAFHIKIVDKTKCDRNGYSEIDLLKDIDSPNVIRLIEHGDLDRENYYLIFEHIEGLTVDKFSKDDWTEEESRKFLLDMATALEALKKQKLVHRDIKSKNIIKDSKTGDYILLDLGIGYFINRPQKSNTPISQTSGAKYFSSPEQMWIASGSGNFNICWISDQFSLGVVAYYSLTGIHPFSGEARPEINNYTELVTGDRSFLKPLLELRPDLSESLSNLVMKMLEVNPTKRFTNLSELKDAIAGTNDRHNTNETKIIIKTPSKAKEKLVEYINTKDNEHEFGILLTAGDNLSFIEKFSSENVEIIFDPQTYKLPRNKSHSNVEVKLNLPKSKDMFEWDSDKVKDYIDDMLYGVIQVNMKIEAKRVILPYFIVDNPDNSYLRLTKDLWKKSKQTVVTSLGEDIEVYGGIVIPKNMITNDERVRLMDSLLSDYDLDGIYVLFENDDAKIRTTTDAKYLKGVSEYLHFFRAIFGKVIVGQADISTICLLDGADFVASWAKSSRHFNLHPPMRKSKKGEPQPPYKMQYYAQKLFTFIEEKTTVAQIVKNVDDEILKCECEYCVASQPLSPAYRELRTIEELHFYENMGMIREIFGLKKPSVERKKIILEKINTYQDNAANVRSKTGLTPDIIPNFEGIISAIKD